MFEAGIAQSGCLRLPARQDLVCDFLKVEWRTIQHYGVEIAGRRYNGHGVNLYRGTRSPHRGRYAGKWPFKVDTDDVRFVFFKDPDNGAWHRLEWEHTANLTAPFSADAAAYAHRFALRQDRHVDPQVAVQTLLADWSKGQVTSRRDRALARRLSAQRAQTEQVPADDRDEAREVASLPGVVDLLGHREPKTTAFDAVDDLDVFEEYYTAHPGADGFEVFEE
jgi:hypothetical protein